jgi:HK97 family phage portal protein
VGPVTLFRRETRSSLENPAIPLSSDAILSVLGGQGTESGIQVNEWTAMSIAAVWRCVSLLAGTMSQLPLRVYTMNGNSRVNQEYPLLDDPYPGITDYEAKELLFAHQLLWGNAYWLKIPNELGNEIVRLFPVPPWLVTPARVRNTANGLYSGQKVYRIASMPAAPLTDEEVLHFPGISLDGIKGLSPIMYAREAMGLAKAAEKSAAHFYGSGSQVAGILKVNRALTAEQATKTKEAWREKHSGLARAHEVAILDSGMDFQQLTMPLADAQFLQSREFSVTEIARFFGVPPHLAGDVDRSTSWGSGIAEQSTGLHRYTVSPYLVRNEARLRMGLLPKGWHARFDTRGLLRGDFAARVAAFATLRTVGGQSVNEFRHEEGWDPIEGGDDYSPLKVSAPAIGVAPDKGKVPKGV